MAVIKHLIETDYKGNFNNMGERIEAIEKEVHNPSYMELTHEGVDSFKVGTDSNGVSVALDSTNSAMDLEGQTLVNLWGNKTSDFQLSNGSYFSNGYITATACNNYMNFFTKNINMYKPSTDYTVIAFIEENTLDGRIFISSDSSGNNSVFPKDYSINAGKTGIISLKMTTKSDLSSCVVGLRSFVDLGCTSGSVKLQIVILEGDHTDKPISFFEGLRSVGEEVEVNGEKRHKIEISSVGKNLLHLEPNTSNLNGLVSSVNSDGSISILGIASATWSMITKMSQNFIPKGTYTLSIDKAVSYNILFSVKYEDGTSGNFYLTNKTTSRICNFTQNVIKTQINLEILVSGNSYNETMYFQLEEGSIATEYEPYKINKTEIFLDEPLRSLPNGVKDEVEIKDGKLIVTRRCGEITMEGQDNLSITGEGWQNETHHCFNFLYKSIPHNAHAIQVLSDKFKAMRRADVSRDLQEEYISNGGSNEAFICIEKSKLTTDDVAGFKKWLQSNNVKVVYTLFTPIKEEFDLLNPILYKDGHVFLETGAVPCSSVSHEVALNTKAQVKNNSKAIVSCRNTFDKAVSVYDEMLLALDYDHTLFDFEYKMNKFGMEEV